MEAAIGIEPMDKGFAVHLYHLPAVCRYGWIALYLVGSVANRASKASCNY
jgi:hypothetical protein